MVDLNALTADELRRVLSYCPKTGEFRWLAKTGTANRVKAGQLAGSVSLGYVKIQVFGRRYFAHRLAWLYVMGAWPREDIDHKDGNRANNTWSNLREATDSQNMRNAKPILGTRAGLKGVTYLPKKGLFNARITADGGRRISLGCYKTADEAHSAYAAKANELFGEFARAA